MKHFITRADYSDLKRGYYKQPGETNYEIYAYISKAKNH